MTTRSLIGWALIAGCFALTAAVYPRLPDPMPTHFDLHGHANGFISKPLGPFLLPLVALLTHAVIAFVPAVSSGRLAVIPIAIAASFVFVVAVALRAALGLEPELFRTLFAGHSLLLVVLGNYLGKIRRNRWVGIRTPWTLADDEVWLRTHRVAGWLLVMGGAASFVTAIGGVALPIVVAPVAAALLVPVAYSFLVYRRLRIRRSSS
jgi:uncharacterized membrane protein